MIVLLNGAFGVGKTTTARTLIELVPTARIADPEIVGGVLQRLGRTFRRPVADFQDLALWRRSVPWLVRARRGAHRAPVIVPMTIWRPDYLAGITADLERLDPEVISVRLTAREATLRARILGRTDAEGDPSWCFDHLPQGLSAFADPAFGVEVPTDDRTPTQVAIAVADLGLW